MQPGKGAGGDLLLEPEGGLEFGDRLFQALGAIEGESVQGVPLRLLGRMTPDTGLELAQQAEGLLRRLCVQGECHLLQPEVQQAQRLLAGGGQPAGAGVVEQGLGVVPEGRLGQGSRVKQLHVWPRLGIEALQIAGGIARRLQFSLFQQGSGLQLGHPEQCQCHHQSHCIFFLTVGAIIEAGSGYTIFLCLSMPVWGSG
ncbi:hypothetical protein D3C72_1301870 [compost metagenome]